MPTLAALSATCSSFNNLKSQNAWG